MRISENDSGEPKQIPPLSQSRRGDMACETLYVRKHVQCARVGESESAARGIEIHQGLATYINPLVRICRTRDLEVFDSPMRGVGAEAREVLEKFRDNHAFDPEKIHAAELHIALDENFIPIEHRGDYGQIAEYEGTLDLVMLHSLTEAEIDDWKSYYQVIEADTFQSKFYPLLLMCLNPSLERHSKLQAVQRPNDGALESRMTILVERITKGERVLEKAQQAEGATERWETYIRETSALKTRIGLLDRLTEFFGTDGAIMRHARVRIGSFTEDLNRHLAAFGYSCNIVLEPFEIRFSSSSDAPSAFR